jgi:outer membrane protein OmpA-like peptidoglycan-associated protein
VPPAQPAASGQASADLSTGVSAGGEIPPPDLDSAGDELSEEMEKYQRRVSLQSSPSLEASTGLMHVVEARSGKPGTFRMNLLSGFYSGSGFLCNAEAPCTTAPGASPSSEDSVDFVGAHLGISATLFPFLEAFVGFHNTATSNSRGVPQLLQVLGDMNVGAKVYWPSDPDTIFLFGGQLNLWLLNGTGSVGLDGGSTSFSIKGLATLDLDNRINPEDRIPLRFDLNLGYLIDNAGNIVNEIEETPPPRGRGARISRIERFGLDIDRVDSVELGLAAEYVHEIVRPFIEWSADLAMNRQSYVCNIDQAAAAGDMCLGEHQELGAMPSRFTLGAKLYPWAERGLAFTAAFDIATGASGTFLEEIAPELPWQLYLGVGYALDTELPKPIIQKIQVAAPPAPPAAPARRYFIGSVTNTKTSEPIPGARLTLDGRNMSGIVTAEDGTFQSLDLEPGNYTFTVSAENYKKGQCIGTIPLDGQAAPIDTAPTPGAAPAPGGVPGAAQPGQPGYDPNQPQAAAVQPAQPAPAAPGAPYSVPGQGAPGPSPSGNGPVEVRLACQLDPLPPVGAVVGRLIDAVTNAPVANASITITDRLGRSLELRSDGAGSFRFDNVPPGQVTIRAQSDGYLASVNAFTIEARKDVQARITMNPRPTSPNVVITGKELKLKSQVHFQNDSADILPDSMALLEEMADVLAANSDITLVEIQGHTDNTGEAAYNLRLSQERADAVREALIRLGVSSDRLSAKGFGPQKPLVPNTNDANKARNRRVQLIILERGN